MSTEVQTGSLKKQVYKWSTFQRYSAFELFDKAIRKELPYQMQETKLPGKKRFGNKTPEFIESRRDALEAYMRAILQIPRVAEFDLHFGSKTLCSFLQFDRRVGGMAGSPTTSPASAPAAAAAPAEPTAAASTGSSRRRGYRKRGTLSGRGTASTSAAPPASTSSGGITSSAPVAASATPKPQSTPAPAPAPAPAPTAASATAPAVAARVIPPDAPPPPPERNSLLASIQKGKKLKKAKTVVKGR